ncbi:MAG: hypothetical protein HRT67_09105 [Flavobacteriaceae bacterium]|nr:hypothetical protein [Flavobacteriaceae bacterium]
MRNIIVILALLVTNLVSSQALSVDLVNSDLQPIEENIQVFIEPNKGSKKLKKQTLTKNELNYFLLPSLWFDLTLKLGNDEMKFTDVDVFSYDQIIIVRDANIPTTCYTSHYIVNEKSFHNTISALYKSVDGVKDCTYYNSVFFLDNKIDISNLENIEYLRMTNSNSPKYNGDN